MLPFKFKLQKIFPSEEARKKSFLLGDFVTMQMEGLKQAGQERTARAYLSTWNCLVRFNQGNDLLLTDLNSELIKHFESYLKRNGKQPNTISFYMRNIRSLYNKARKSNPGLKMHECCFDEVYTGVDKTAKRAVKKTVIDKLALLDLSSHPGLLLSQQLFLFSFYTRGMSFVDMAFLKKSDVKDGIIRYRRQKTGRALEVKVTPEIARIINQYKPMMKKSPYLLPIILDSDLSNRLQYESALKTHNNRLKKLSELIHLQTPVTSYVARHSWATIAKERNIPIAVISEGLGHNSQQTTMIYLASFDSAVLHKANAKVIA